MMETPGLPEGPTGLRFHSGVQMLATLGIPIGGIDNAREPGERQNRACNPVKVMHSG